MRTLHPFTAERREGLCGIRILDPFGGHRQIETLGEIGQQAHDFDVENLLLIIADKGGADFDLVERQLREAGKRNRGCPQAVDTQTHTEFFQTRKGGFQLFGRNGESRLMHFDRQPFERCFPGAQRTIEEIREVGLCHAAGG